MNAPLYLPFVFIVAASLGLLACFTCEVDAKDTTGKGKPSKVHSAPAANASPSTAKENEPWLRVGVAIQQEERVVIQEYARECTTPAKHGSKPKGLPPGLAKKVAKGGTLPPGWEKKCVKGQVMTPEVYKECQPLPKEIIVKLPPPPKGTILVTIDGKVVRLLQATLEILDVFEVLP